MLFWISILWPSSNDTIFHHFHNLVFCHHFITILSQFCHNFTMRRRKLCTSEKLNQAIGGYYNGAKKVIAVTELMNVWLDIVEASVQMIIDACEFVVPALYQLVKTPFFVKNHIFAFAHLPIGLKSQFQAQTGRFIVSHKVVTRKKVVFLVKFSLLKTTFHISKRKVNSITG